MKKVALLIAVALLVLAAPADARHRAAAAHHAIRYSPISAAYTVAARYWHQQPCDGDITIVVEPPWPNDAANPEGAATSMWASWDRGTPWENREDAPMPFHGCVIGVNSLVWTSAEREGLTMWPEFAIDMIHEFHHLMGYGDLFATTDSGSIDYIEPSSNVAVTGLTAPGWA